MDREEPKQSRFRRYIFQHQFQEVSVIWVKVTPRRIQHRWHGTGTARIWEFKDFCQWLWDHGNKRTCKYLLYKFERKELMK